jgi:hypothetical protein
MWFEPRAISQLCALTARDDAENVAVRDALAAYAHRAGPDDFSAWF